MLFHTVDVIVYLFLQLFQCLFNAVSKVIDDEPNERQAENDDVETPEEAKMHGHIFLQLCHFS